MNIQTLKGFRDFLPKEARKREYVKNTLKRVFESYGFEPLETPVLEYDAILAGKYGDEGEKLMYRFEDNGGRKVAMRYDLTVPVARVAAEYQNELPTPFKRYQMQNVYRAENTQKGRFREFMQCDADTIGIDSALADAEIIACAVSIYKQLGFKNVKALINDRNIFEGLPLTAVIIIDKLKKIGVDGVVEELIAKGIAKDASEARNILQSITDAKPSERLQQIMAKLTEMGIDESQYEFSPTLARGLDYYTGLIVEIECPDYPTGSLGGGGRYDNLIGMFSKNKLPAVGFSVGFDRTIEAMEALNLFPKNVEQSATKALVTVFNKELEQKSVEVSSLLRASNINCELYLSDSKMEKQLKYADAKQILYVIIIGPEEAEKNVVTLKNLKERSQESLPLDQLLKKLQY